MIRKSLALHWVGSWTMLCAICAFAGNTASAADAYDAAVAHAGRSDADLKRDLLIGRPLGFSAQGFKGLQNFGRGSSGISGAKCDPGIKGGQSNCFVTAQQSWCLILQKRIQCESCGC